MVQKKVIFKQIILANGRSFAEARSVALFSEDSENTISQTVTVNVSSGNSYTSSFSSSSSRSSSRSSVSSSSAS
jgi:hypothetical protein